MNKFLKEFLAENEARWQVIILQQELQELERERRHLETKERERGLTSWEYLRARECKTEISQLIAKFRDLPGNSTLGSSQSALPPRAA